MWLSVKCRSVCVCVIFQFMFVLSIGFSATKDIAVWHFCIMHKLPPVLSRAVWCCTDLLLSIHFQLQERGRWMVLHEIFNNLDGMGIVGSMSKTAGWDYMAKTFLGWNRLKVQSRLGLNLIVQCFLFGAGQIVTKLQN